MLAATWTAYPSWLNSGDNAWQLTAATFVGLMSVPGLVVLYGGVMQKRWSVNSMMLTFAAFALVLIVWVLWGFKMGFGTPWHGLTNGEGSGLKGFFGSFIGKPGSVLDHAAEQGQAVIPSITTGPAFNFPTSTLVYFQLVFAAITPILMLGSVLGRINFKAWLVFVPLWTTFIYTVNAFLIWGGGFWAAHGRVDFSGGYVIHLSAGVSGLRRGCCDRATPRTRPRDRRTEQPADGRRRRRPAVARLERLQRRRSVLRGRRRGGCRAEHEPGHCGGVPRLGRAGTTRPGGSRR